jgi:hypothetical protein
MLRLMVQDRELARSVKYKNMKVDVVLQKLPMAGWAQLRDSVVAE